MPPAPPAARWMWWRRTATPGSKSRATAASAPRASTGSAALGTPKVCALPFGCGSFSCLCGDRPDGPQCNHVLPVRRCSVPLGSTLLRAGCADRSAESSMQYLFHSDITAPELLQAAEQPANAATSRAGEASRQIILATLIVRYRAAGSCGDALLHATVNTARAGGAFPSGRFPSPDLLQGCCSRQRSSWPSRQHPATRCAGRRPRW